MIFIKFTFLLNGILNKKNNQFLGGKISEFQTTIFKKRSVKNHDCGFFLANIYYKSMWKLLWAILQNEYN